MAEFKDMSPLETTPDPASADVLPDGETSSSDPNDNKEPTNPQEETRSEFKTSWRKQVELLNRPYNFGSSGGFPVFIYQTAPVQAVLANQAVLENQAVSANQAVSQTVNSPQPSSARVIRNTGLLGEHNIELDLGSDHSSDGIKESISSGVPSDVSSVVYSWLFKQPKMDPATWKNAVTILHLAGNKMYPNGGDGTLLRVRSTFNVKSLACQLKQVEAPIATTPTWTLGFDAQIFALANRTLPEWLLMVSGALVRLQGSSDKIAFKQYILGLKSHKERVLSEMRDIIHPANAQLRQEATPQFKQLAAAFFGGRKVDKDCGVIDKATQSSDNEDSNDSEPGIELGDDAYTITYKTGDRFKVMVEQPLEDDALATFLIDVVLSNEIQKMVQTDAQYKSMKVYHSAERKSLMTRLLVVQNAWKRGEPGLWKDKNMNVRVGLKSDGSICLEDVIAKTSEDDKTELVTKDHSEINGSKVLSETEDSKAKSEIQEDGSEQATRAEGLDKVEPLEEAQSKSTKSKRKKKSKKQADKTGLGISYNHTVPAGTTEALVTNGAAKAAEAPTTKSEKRKSSSPCFDEKEKVTSDEEGQKVKKSESPSQFAENHAAVKGKSSMSEEYQADPPTTYPIAEAVSTIVSDTQLDAHLTETTDTSEVADALGSSSAVQTESITQDIAHNESISEHADSTVSVTATIDPINDEQSPAQAKPHTRNDGWKQVKKPKASRKRKAAKKNVALESQASSSLHTESTPPKPKDDEIPEPRGQEVMTTTTEPTLPVTTTPAKVRRDSVHTISTMVSPAIVEMNISSITSENAVDTSALDTSALSSVPDMSESIVHVADSGSETKKDDHMKMLPPVQDVDQSASSISIGEMPVQDPVPDHSSTEPTVIEASRQDTVVEELVESNLAWADLTLPSKSLPRQRFSSLQNVTTRFKEEGDPLLEEPEHAQMTAVRDPRVLGLQFGDMPIGYGLQLPVGCTRELRLYFPDAPPINSDDEESDDEPLENTDNSPRAPQSSEPQTQYHTTSPLVILVLPAIGALRTEVDGCSASVSQQDLPSDTRASRSFSAPCPPASNAAALTDELAVITDYEQQALDGSSHQYDESSYIDESSFERHDHSLNEEPVLSSFTCLCCRVTRLPTRDAPAYICPFCGPLTNVRYCSRACMLAEAFDHGSHCINYPASQAVVSVNLPSNYVYDMDPIMGLQKWETSSQALFRQKIFSMYCFSGPFPEVCNAWTMKFGNRADIYPAYVDESKVTGDYHVFRSEVSAVGKFSPTEVLTTFRIPETDPMKRDFNRLLNACFMFSKMDHSLLISLYRLIRHFILYEGSHNYYRHSFPAVPREILYPEFRHQFKEEFGIQFPLGDEPAPLNLAEEWPMIHTAICRYEMAYPHLVMYLGRKLSTPLQ